jgi:hypothetical protein
MVCPKWRQLFGDGSSTLPGRVKLDRSRPGHPTLSADLAVLAETRLAARTFSISELTTLGQQTAEPTRMDPATVCRRAQKWSRSACEVSCAERASGPHALGVNIEGFECEGIVVKRVWREGFQAAAALSPKAATVCGSLASLPIDSAAQTCTGVGHRRAANAIAPWSITTTSTSAAVSRRAW